MSELKNLVGKQYNRLTVISRAPNHKGRTAWNCLCACGKTVTVYAINLNNNSTQSCGCLSKENASKRTKRDLTGLRFSRLIVLEDVGKNKSGNYIWRCQCDCGNITTVSSSNLIRKNTHSCGCYNADRMSETFTTHGLTGTREYNAYRARKRSEIKKKIDAGWTAEMETELRNFFPRCVVCGMNQQESYESFGCSLEVDHILPLSKGYGLCVGNAIILCRRCNQKKKDKFLFDLPSEIKEPIMFASTIFEHYWRQVKNHE